MRFTTLSNYHLIDWLIDNAMFVCLLDELILGFCCSDFDMGNRWVWTRIDYHPCITSEPTNQVLVSPNVAEIWCEYGSSATTISY